MRNLLLILILVFGSFSIKAQSKAEAIAEAAKFGIGLAPKIAEAIWGINIQNGTSGEFSAVGYQPASTNSGINLTYNVTDMLENGFMLNLQALVENSIAKIATNPHITVNNGGDAEINITDDKYILLETATINGITTTLQDISTGIQLKITPRLAADSTIHLTVTSSISEFIATSVSGGV